MSLKNIVTGIAAAFVSVATISAPLAAQDAAQVFALELNNAADTPEGGCRLTYVATNGTGQALASVSYQVAVFDADAIVTDLLVLEFGELTDGKTKVVQFDLGGRTCASLSKITVNEVAACAVADGTEGDFCMSALETRSRSVIQFGT